MLMRIAAAAVAAASVLALPGAARADILQGCASELASYCAGVTPGEGRITACIYAHSDKISDGCLIAAQDTLLQIDFAMARMRLAMDVCAPDILANCAGTEVGGGRILMCLAEHRDKLSEGCGSIVDRVAEAIFVEESAPAEAGTPAPATPAAPAAAPSAPAPTTPAN